MNAAAGDQEQLCWRQQGCGGCLQEHCMWCPSSSTCVPNTSRIPILAPISNPDVCSLWSDRWEARSEPLGCHVSTITFLICIITVVSTLLFIGILIFALIWGIKLRQLWKKRSGGWKIWTWNYWKDWKLEIRDVQQPQHPEQRPLLR